MAEIRSCDDEHTATIVKAEYTIITEYDVSSSGLSFRRDLCHTHFAKRLAYAIAVDKPDHRYTFYKL